MTNAKSLQLCPTLCDLIDGSLPGSSVHGIFQARILEWIAISFSCMYVCVCVCVYCGCLVTKLCPTLLRPHGL